MKRTRQEGMCGVVAMAVARQTINRVATASLQRFGTLVEMLDKGLHHRANFDIQGFFSHVCSEENIAASLSSLLVMRTKVDFISVLSATEAALDHYLAVAPENYRRALHDVFVYDVSTLDAYWWVLHHLVETETLQWELRRRWNVVIARHYQPPKVPDAPLKEPKIFEALEDFFNNPHNDTKKNEQEEEELHF